jgi:CDP-paratose 2-epimerase
MRVLVTGGAGLVGSHTAEYYAKRGEKVTVLDNLMRSKLFGWNKKSVEYNWKYLQRYKNIKRVRGDIRDERTLAKVIKGANVVIHAAAQPGVLLSAKDPRQDFSINAYGTFNVLEALRKHAPGAVFIYCSTNKVYGENVSRFTLVEKNTRYVYKEIAGINEGLAADYTARTPYGASKYSGDIYTQEYARIYGLRTAVFRMSCIYGPRQFGFEDQGWVAWFTIASILNRPVTIYGDGKQVRDLLYIDDLIQAFDSFVNSNLRHAVFNIGGGPDNTISLMEFLDFLQNQMRIRMQVSFSQWRKADQKVYISDITRLREKLNWQPKIPILEGSQKLIEWARQHKTLF